ncbi:M14 family metallopeptidase [Paraferrimonas sedimenticola]|uniref:M14 family metallopeptidase n=1 Tax=Paraferrimonas sedimenticola TaxID=375674 RepID=UPI000BA8FA7F|nr:M14-type cytosolic carboxypeptidase [Paraferrimonas sedimenticola]
MRINSQFDGGNIQVIDASKASDIQLSIRPDEGGEFFQWFNFRLQGEIGVKHQLRLTNASKASYVEGWDGYHAVASYDRQNWFRIPCHYSQGELHMEIELQAEQVQIAYFAPYSFERHLDLLAECQSHPLVAVETLGDTLDGRELSLMKVSTGEGDKAKVWITARQHPGETMAEWWVEGFMQRLLDPDCARARQLLDLADVYIVPNMNPDGSVRGHLRTNAKGVNLNREWQSPSLENSPEVLLTRDRMMVEGVDFYLDVHGDEALPYIFLAGGEGIPAWNDEMAAKQACFLDMMTLAAADFQTEQGYPVDKPGDANLTVASNWVGNHFNCLANTLEMPFKDNANLPDEATGWSAERSQALGEDCLDAISLYLQAQVG